MPTFLGGIREYALQNKDISQKGQKSWIPDNGRIFNLEEWQLQVPE